MARERFTIFKVGGLLVFPLTLLSRPFRAITILPSSKRLSTVRRILALFALTFICSAAPVMADVTLEILNLTFPDTCGAVRNEEITTCTRCHSSQPTVTPGKRRYRKIEKNPIDYRTVTSLEEQGRITATVPAEPLVPGQSFSQRIVFNGPAIMYVYGYAKDEGPYQVLDSRWILDSPEMDFLEEHNGTSLPLFKEPGQYTFILKLLHSRSGDLKKGFQWEEVVLFWTLSVEG